MVEIVAVVYFAIKTENNSIEESYINDSIGLKPTEYTKMLSKGDRPKCTLWSISTGKIKNPDVSEMITQICDILSPKKIELRRFKEINSDISYVFEIVLYHGDNAAGFSISKEQLYLLSEIGALIDVDQYNYKE